MLGFKVNNEYLDLLPDSQMEIEENNPFLQFTEEIVGEYSLPIDLPNTAKNNRLLGYAGMVQKRITDTGIEALAYDSGFQHSKGKLKFEKIQHQLNHGASNRFSMYYLTGTSYFWQDLKNKKLRDVNFGGSRSFTWDNWVRNGSGFWGHIHSVIDAAPGSFDYAFYPVLVDDFEWDDTASKTWGSHVLNMMEYSGGQANFSQRGDITNNAFFDASIIVPFPYISYLMKKIVAHVGWQLDEGDMASDPDYHRATLVNAKAINWCSYYPHDLVHGNNIYPFTNIAFDLQDHVPDVGISEFLMAMRNRFGWWYDIDKVNKIIRIRKIALTAAGATKNISAKTNPNVTKTILTEKKIYGLRNTATERELKLSDYVYDGEVFQNLPAASSSLESHVMLVIADNNYYICFQDENTGSWSWEKLSGNDADVVPTGATEFITGNSTALTSEVFNSYLDLIPRSNQGGFWPGRTEDNRSNDIELCYFYGLRPNKSAQNFPYGHHHIYDSAGNQVGNYSLSFSGKKADGTEVGLYDLNFKPFLERVASSEELEIVCYFNRNEFMSMKYSDTLVLNGVKLYIKQRKYVIPYKNAVTLMCIRIQK